MIDWEKHFAEAHLKTWPPPRASLCIQNRNPSPSQGGRNIFQDDREQIEAAAAKHGYRRISDLKAAVISYVKP